MYIYICEISTLPFQKHVDEPFTFFSHKITKGCNELHTKAVFGAADLVIITPIL